MPEVKESGFSELITKTIGNIHDKKNTIVSLIKEFNLDKNNSFYVGDTSGDIEAGKNAKIATIGISWGFQHKDILSKSKPKFLIDDIVEIKEIIRGF